MYCPRLNFNFIWIFPTLLSLAAKFFKDENIHFFLQLIADSQRLLAAYRGEQIALPVEASFDDGFNFGGYGKDVGVV